MIGRKGLRAIALVFLAIGTLINSCQKHIDSVSSVYGENLLRNPSFEENGKTRTDYWRIHNYPGFQFAKDAPAGGGEWSVSLPSGQMPPNTYISQTIPTPEGLRDFQFSFWAKNQVQGSRGRVVGIYSDSTLTLATVETSAENEWKQYIYSFQIPVPAPDSLRVELWATSTEIIRIITLYDLVSLRGTR